MPFCLIKIPVKRFWFVICILLPFNIAFLTFTNCGSSSYMLIRRDGLYFALTTKTNGQTPNEKQMPKAAREEVSSRSDMNEDSITPMSILIT